MSRPATSAITYDIIDGYYMPIAPSCCNPGGEDFGHEFTYDDICRHWKNWVGEENDDYPLNRVQFGILLANMIYHIRGTTWLENRQRDGVRYYRIHKTWWYPQDKTWWYEEEKR